MHWFSIEFEWVFEAQNDANMSPNTITFFDQKTSLIFEWFFIDCLDGFLEPKSLKMSTSCRRDAHFRKIVFFDSGTILEQQIR